jgi:cytochrome c-type biogenesis protein CcmF
MCISIAFLCVAYAFVLSDFSLALTAKNSHTSKPLLYKISGIWANHEGSMLLWVWIHAFVGALFVLMNKKSTNFTSNTLGFHAILSIAFLAFLLFTSNPFERLWPAPTDGKGLNPLLQDPALAFHPPFLYLGYVGFSIGFCISLAFLKEKTLPQNWVKTLRFWTILPWSMLTIGITLGSFWAYYELGWGGWWFWDPVENASLMPWLLGTALLHVLPLVQKNRIDQKWPLLLALCIFNLSVFGTFIVRSGFLTSVHSFALDPQRGIILFSILLGLLTLSLLHYFFYKTPQKTLVQFSFFSKETSLIAQSIFLIAASLIIFFSMLYPYLIEIYNGNQISLDPSFFEKSFVPLMIPFAFLLPIAPFLNWRHGNFSTIKHIIVAPFIAAIILSIVIGLNYNTTRFYPFLGLFLSFWCLLGTILYAYQLYKKDKFQAIIEKMPMLLAHFGFGIALLGMIGSTTWHKEQTLLLKEGQQIEFQSIVFKLLALKEVKGPNYLSLMANFQLTKNGVPKAILSPERRLYPIEQKSTTEIAIHTYFLNDYYLVLGEEDPLKRGWGFKFHYYPLVILIWLGCLIIALGGILGFLFYFYRRKKQ